MKTDWRIARGWSEAALERRLAEVVSWDRNFDAAAPKTPAAGWQRHESQSVVARERPGPPEPRGGFERGWEAIVRYEFSDPRIVRAHFDPTDPLEGRLMLLELQALCLHFLAPVVVGAVRFDHAPDQTEFAFRYDTLRSHVESGWEWFRLTKAHDTGVVCFRIEADWRAGEFPNWWSRLGFHLLARHYQRRWTRHAHQRLREIIERGRPGGRQYREALHEHGHQRRRASAPVEIPVEGGCDPDAGDRARAPRQRVSATKRSVAASVARWRRLRLW